MSMETPRVESSKYAPKATEAVAAAIGPATAVAGDIFVQGCVDLVRLTDGTGTNQARTAKKPI